MMVRIALYQPDIPQNTGTILRLAACLGLDVDIIEPAGFTLSDKALRRAGMDYLELARLSRHLSFDHFLTSPQRSVARLVLLTTKAEIAYTDFSFAENDILLFGRESAGVPGAVHGQADHALIIPMDRKARSLNLALSVAMVVGEALRQTEKFPKQRNFQN